MYIQFAEKFQEFKEAARLAKEKSQEKMELTSTPSQVSFSASFKACISNSVHTVLRISIVSYKHMLCYKKEQGISHLAWILSMVNRRSVQKSKNTFNVCSRGVKGSCFWSWLDLAAVHHGTAPGLS